MFDIGFFELVLVGVVALVVLGPEKLPGAIRTASLWIGRLRRSFNNIKQDIEKEIGADEIRRQLRNEAIMDKFKNTKSQMTDTINMVKKETDAFRKNVELESQVAGLSSTQAGAPPAPPAPTSTDTANTTATPLPTTQTTSPTTSESTPADTAQA